MRLTLIVALSVAVFATTDHLLTMSLVPLYGVVTSLVLAHGQQYLSTSRNSRSAGKRAGIVASVGAFTGSLLLQASVPAGIAGFGLMLLGMSGTLADVAAR
jgi:threonine/homoserine/homoserine lactone efflux protein